MLTPRIALAPSLALFGVPSRSIMSWSIASWSRGSRPISSGAILLLTFSTALVDALADVDLLVAVAQLDRLVLAGAGAGRDGGAAERAVLEQDVHLDGRVAAGVEDLPALDEFDVEAHVAVRPDTGGNAGVRRPLPWKRSHPRGRRPQRDAPVLSDGSGADLQFCNPPGDPCVCGEGNHRGSPRHSRAQSYARGRGVKRGGRLGPPSYGGHGPPARWAPVVGREPTSGASGQRRPPAGPVSGRACPQCQHWVNCSSTFSPQFAHVHVGRGGNSSTAASAWSRRL